MAYLDIEASGLTAMQQLCNPKQFRKDLEAGLRYTLPGVKKTIAKEIGTHYAIPAARIKKDVKKMTYDDNGITVVFNRNPPTLRAYGGKPIGSRTTSKGVGIPIGIKYKIFKGQQMKRPNAFWLPLGPQPVPGLPFRRNGPGASNLTALYGPSIGSIFVGKSAFGEKMRESTTEAAGVQFLKGVERNMARRTRGY